MRYLRPHDIYYERNDFPPPQRIAKRYPKKEQFFGAIVEAVNAGRKVFICWAAMPERLKTLCETYFEGRIPYKMYTSSSDDRDKLALADVRREWQQLRVVATTPTITVGVNYDILDFDELFVYGSPNTCCVHDLFQMTMRVRHMNLNVMHCHIGTVCILPAAPTFRLGQQAIRTQIASRQDRIEQFIRAHGYLDLWEQEPQWFLTNHVLNIQEDNFSHLKYEQEFHRYLRICNYELIDANAQPDLEIFPTKIPYETIESIDAAQAQTIIINKNNRIATEADKNRLEKYQFDLLLDRHLPVEERSLLWSDWWQEKSNQPLLLNIYAEKNRLTQSIYNHEMQHGFKFMAPEVFDRRENIERICNLLRIPNSCAGTTISHADFATIIPSLYPLIGNLQNLFPIRVQTTEASSPKVTLVKTLHKIFRSWNGSTFKLAARRRERTDNNIRDVTKSDLSTIWNDIRTAHPQPFLLEFPSTTALPVSAPLRLRIIPPPTGNNNTNNNTTV